VGAGVIALWAPIALLITGSVMLSHVVAMPDPDPDAHARLLAAYQVDEGVVHVISMGCSCTTGLLDHLGARGRLPERRETVFLIGAADEPARRLTERGYEVHVLPRDRAEGELGLDVAPVLIVFADDGAMAWRGGYFAVPAANDPLDDEVIAAVDAGEAPASLPVFGCAVDPALRRQLDPLGLTQ